MKAINYADQRRVPLIHVRIHNDYQPKSWLGEPAGWKASRRRRQQISH